MGSKIHPPIVAVCGKNLAVLELWDLVTLPDTCLKIENKNMEFQTSSVVYREYLQNKKFNLLYRTRNNVERRNSTELMSTSDLHSDLQTNVQLLSFEGIVK